MAEKDIQQQINEINKKLDTLLLYVDQQRLKADESRDLMTDINLIGTEMFHATVEELEHENIEVDMAMMKQMFFRLLKNMNTFNQMVEMLESTNDLLKDVKPISRDVILNLIHQVSELEEKGYLDFLLEARNIIDNIVTHFGPGDVKDLADNIVNILETIKSITQPEMMAAINNAVAVYKHMDQENIPEYSIFKAMRELNKPEMRKGIGFMISFLQNISKANK